MLIRVIAFVLRQYNYTLLKRLFRFSIEGLYDLQRGDWQTDHDGFDEFAKESQIRQMWQRDLLTA